MFTTLTTPQQVEQFNYYQEHIDELYNTFKLLKSHKIQILLQSVQTQITSITGCSPEQSLGDIKFDLTVLYLTLQKLHLERQQIEQVESLCEVL